MKKAFLTALVVAVSASFCCAFYNPSDPYFTRLHKETFSGKKPREIARFLAHPDTLTQKGAVAALADTPDDALPLVVSWYQALDRELSVLEAQWDAGVEQMPDVVPALCRAVVRLPRGKTNSGNLHGRAKRLLDRCSSASAATIRACAKEEAVWLAGVEDGELLRILNGFSAKRLNGDEARSACMDEIKYLGSLADGLEGR